MLPNFLGLGGNRSGSTWLAHNLRRHPDVFLPRQKELHFFDKYYENGLAYYEEFFSGWAGETAVGEVTPEYFYTEDVAAKVKRDLPDVRLFVSLRNPVERAYSQYWRMVATGRVSDETTFEEALQTKEIIHNYNSFHKHLSRFYRYFDAQDVLVLIFEDIKHDPESVLFELFNFLGVEPTLEGGFETEAVNSSATLPNLGRSKILWYFQRGFNRFRLDTLRSAVDKANRKSLPPMNDETRAALTEQYRDEILRTEALIGKDLSGWLQVSER